MAGFKTTESEPMSIATPQPPRAAERALKYQTEPSEVRRPARG
jgi:hypothetical protein